MLVAEMNPEEIGKILVLTSYFAISLQESMMDKGFALLLVNDGIKVGEEKHEKGEAQENHQERDSPLVHSSSSLPLLYFFVPPHLIQDCLKNKYQKLPGPH
ncbi:hypothetical protein ACOSQ2_016428 [Xanthoceras sorbifolium]